jgi:hypothetical protein
MHPSPLQWTTNLCPIEEPNFESLGLHEAVTETETERETERV